MFCPACGAQCPDHSTFCAACGAKLTAQPQQQTQQPVQVVQTSGPAGLAFPIVMTCISFLCCCNLIATVLAVIGIVLAAQSRNLFAAGDLAGAAAKAKTVKALCIWSIVVCVAGIILSVIISAISGAAGMLPLFAMLAEGEIDMEDLFRELEYMFY